MIDIIATSDGNKLNYSEDHKKQIKKLLVKYQGQELFVHYEKFNPKRSNDQNRYLWAIYDILSKDIGESIYYYHEWCKSYFIKQIPGIKIIMKPIIILGKNDGLMAMIEVDGIEKPLSTKHLTTKQFAEYIELIRVFFNDQGYYIPTSEQYYESLRG